MMQIPRPHTETPGNCIFNRLLGIPDGKMPLCAPNPLPRPAPQSSPFLTSFSSQPGAWLAKGAFDSGLSPHFPRVL